MQQMFLLQILLFAQHVSGTIMPIIRSSRVLYYIYYIIVFIHAIFLDRKTEIYCYIRKRLYYSK